MAGRKQAGGGDRGEMGGCDRSCEAQLCSSNVNSRLTSSRFSRGQVQSSRFLNGAGGGDGRDLLGEWRCKPM